MLKTASDNLTMDAQQLSSPGVRRTLQESWKFRVDGDFLDDVAETLVVLAERSRNYAEVRDTDLEEYHTICDTINLLREQSFIRYSDLMNPHILQGFQSIGLTLDCETILQNPDARPNASEGRMEVFIRGIDLISPEDYANRQTRKPKKMPLSFRSIIKDQVAAEKDRSAAVYLQDCENDVVHSALYYVIFTHDTVNEVNPEEALYFREHFRDTHASALSQQLSDSARTVLDHVVSEMDAYTSIKLVPAWELRAFCQEILAHFEDEYVSLTMSLEANGAKGDLDYQVMQEINKELTQMVSPEQLPELLRKHVGNRHGMWD